MTQQLPTRLGKSPLVEAIFELRIGTELALSQILSGILYTSLNCTNIEKLPPADIPEFVRNSDPNLKYAALSRLKWGQYHISVGDNSIGLSTGYPYPGWASFKSKIIELLNATAPYNFVKSVERFSLKYIDIFPMPEYELADKNFSIGLQVPGAKLNHSATQIRTEITDESTVHILQLVGEATGNIPEHNEIKHGVLMDIDSIEMVPIQTLPSLLSDIDDSLNTLHAKNKALFFSMLSPEGIEKLEPKYD